MGCQNSRLVNPDILAIPPKLRPLLWRKVEEIRRRRSSAASGHSLSKKDLLRESRRGRGRGNGSEETEALTHHRSVHESVSTSNNSSSRAKPRQQEKYGNVADDQDHEVIIIKESNVESEKETETETEKEKEERGIGEVVDDHDDEEEEEEDEDEDDDDDDDDLCNEERNLCAGSPSFRVYYLESLEEIKRNNDIIDEELSGNINDHDAKDDEGIVADEIMQKKLSRESSVESIAYEDSNVILNEEKQESVKTMTQKRRKNRKRITKAIRRGPVAMKQFLNVKSCYHPSNNETASLLAKKTHQTVE